MIIYISQKIIYDTAQFKLEGKLRVVMPSCSKCIISLAISSVSTHKATCLKNAHSYILCKHACINLGSCKCINEYLQRIYNTSPPVLMIIIVDCMTSSQPRVTKH